MAAKICKLDHSYKRCPFNRQSFGRLWGV